MTDMPVKNSIPVFFAALFLTGTQKVHAAAGDTSMLEDLLTGEQSTDIVRILVILTILTILPALILTLTSFTRIIIVLSFTRSAMGTQQSPPNQILIGIAIILSFFIMSPVINQVRQMAYDPLMAGEVEASEALDTALVPIKEFMFDQTSSEPEGLEYFLGLYGFEETPESLEEIPMSVLMISFVTSELKKAMIMGFLIYVPFIVIDMIVSSILMSMGMMMLPPAMISLPFKILLFIMIDGWTLLSKTIIAGFNLGG